MTIIRLQGGLGNQLFQYAYGRSLELSGKKITFDTSFFNGNKAKIDTDRTFKLNVFNIRTLAEFRDMRRPFTDFVNKIMVKSKLKKNGFWQSEMYFITIEREIREEFTLKNPLQSEASDISRIIDSTPTSISLHVRRGDYASDPNTSKYWGTCSPEYYSKALECLTAKIGKNIRIFVFSDDIEWVKTNIHLPYPTTYVSSPGIKDYEELVLMSQCSHHIIANSSFSWWGAWLDPKSDKIVIAPKRWTLKDDGNFKDIIPDSWIRI